jgi:hypothetical protein
MGQTARETQGRKEKIFQMIPMATVGGGWVMDNEEMRWRKISKLKQNPGLLIKISKKIENEGGLVEKKPVDYFIKNGQTTDRNNATADGCYPDDVYRALRDHPELGKRFKLVEYTENQADIEAAALKIKAIITKKDQQTMLEGSEALADGKSDSRFQTPNAALANSLINDLADSGLHSMNVAGMSQLQKQPIITDSGMVTSEIMPFNE